LPSLLLLEAVQARNSLAAPGRRSGALSREQLLHTGSALFIEKAACLFKPLRCDVVAGSQYYIFRVGQLFCSRVENRIRCVRTPLIVASAFRHHLSCV